MQWIIVPERHLLGAINILKTQIFLKLTGIKVGRKDHNPTSGQQYNFYFMKKAYLIDPNNYGSMD
jgi:hypothetical protein